MSTQPSPRYLPCLLCECWHEPRPASVCADAWVVKLIALKKDAKKGAK